jgi:succinate dehydrogenase/fumarate reductase flavoprotein subunit
MPKNRNPNAAPTPISASTAPPTSFPIRASHRLSSRRFYAVRVVPGGLGTFAGIATNAHAQVIDGDGVALEGLYAVGNDAASVMGGTYPGAGITIGPAMTFGYVAARHLAASRKRTLCAPTTPLASGQPASSASSSPVASS